MLTPQPPVLHVLLANLQQSLELLWPQYVHLVPKGIIRPHQGPPVGVPAHSVMVVHIQQQLLPLILQHAAFALLANIPLHLLPLHQAHARIVYLVALHLHQGHRYVPCVLQVHT